jgi:galactoside O-acetyltransferase
MLFVFNSVIKGYRATLRLVANHTLLPFLRIYMLKLSGIKIGKRVFINLGFTVIDDYRGMIEIEDEAAIASNVTVVSVSYPNESFISKEYKLSKEAPVKIKKGAWIGTGVVILPGVTIGQGSIIGALALVNKDVPEFAIVGGVPAKILGDVREKQKVIKKGE